MPPFHRPALALLALCAVLACTPAPRGLEAFVKTNHDDLVQQISAGGGDLLQEAMTLAGIAPQNQPARALQLQGDAGLYAASPDILIRRLATFGR